MTDFCRLWIKKILWNLKEHGPIYMVQMAFLTGWRKVFQDSENVFYLDCSQLPEEGSRLLENLIVERYDKREDIPEEILDDLRFHIRKKDMEAEIAEQYLTKMLGLFHEGGVMWAAKNENKLAGYFWTFLYNDNYAPYFLQFPLTTGEAVFVSGLIFPEYRGLGIFTALLRYVAFQLKKEGIQSIFNCVKVWNQASARAVIKAGFNIIGTQRPIKILGRRVIIWSKRRVV